MEVSERHREGHPFHASELDYALPESAIAQEPLAERDASRLLCMPRGVADLRHALVRDLPELLEPSLLVLNDTRVLPARLVGRRPSGGKVELLLVERVSEPGAVESWLALGKPQRALAQGAELSFGDGLLQARVTGRRADGIELELRSPGGVKAALQQLGRVPLPPYIRRSAGMADVERYQTVYAAHDGAVAAPTAGLHLTSALLERLRASGHELAYLTLHVGPGTFAPLRSEDLGAHVMHPERYEIPEATAVAIGRARIEGRPVLAVGTTVARALESAVDAGGSVRPGAGSTALFIYPPYRFAVVDALMTNFHLPRSTLLALVMAFGGVEPVREAYQVALAQGYRFYSYGDAMLIRSSGIS
jgi:S-adenosylmethionine:tRNA ribosyltransferase-isomerase